MWLQFPPREYLEFLYFWYRTLVFLAPRYLVYGKMGMPAPRRRLAEDPRSTHTGKAISEKHLEMILGVSFFLRLGKTLGQFRGTGLEVLPSI